MKHISLLGWGALVVLLGGCATPELPDSSSETYQDVVTAFYASVASVQSGEDAGAEQKLQDVIEWAPGEPAGWYNLGLLSLRQNRFDEGRVWLDEALARAPENAQIHRLVGVMELTLGNAAAGEAALRRAVALDETDVKAWFALAQHLGQLEGETEMQEALHIFEQLVTLLPENLAVHVEHARLAARHGDVSRLTPSLDVLDNLSGSWDDPVREPLIALQEAVTTANTQQAFVQAGFLRNMLLSTYAFRQDLLQVQTPTEEVGDLMDQFVRLPSPTPQLAPPDSSLRYSRETLDQGELFGAIARMHLMDGEGSPDLLVASHNGVRINADRFDRPSTGSGEFGVGLLDYDYDFRVDIVHASEAGLFFLRQDTLGGYELQDAGAMVDPYYATLPYTGVWVADLDSEGDLDLLLSSPTDGTFALRNNGDNTFSRLFLFDDVSQLNQFVWADFDADGDPDAALVGENGMLFVYANERMGQFVRRAVPPVLEALQTIATGDVNADGRMDVIGLTMQGRVFRISDTPEETWEIEELVPDAHGGADPMAPHHLIVQDLDNNGGLDVLVSTPSSSRIWLNDGFGQFNILPQVLEGSIHEVADMNGDGLLDALGIDEDGQLTQWQSTSAAGYNWQVIRPRAGQALGDQRINSFAIGGEIEIRAGLLYQKQSIASPAVHFGLGTRERTDVARLIWPNGDIQSEFDLAADQSIFTPQRLKGSCPWLFTFDGEGMQFVTDFIWRSPLGLRINAQETAGVMTTEDRVKIRGDQLVPRDGMYDVRITAELWETHFFDHVSLIAVDHPADTEIFIDERFAFPPPDLSVYHMSRVHPFASVQTDSGENALNIVQERDGHYLDFFGRGRYQGITREHTVEMALTPEMREHEAVVLVGFGWVRPTDSSINVAIGQGRHSAPQGLVLEIPNAQNEWEVAIPDIGFPAGKTKTIVIDLSSVLADASIDRIRLRTNLEIYWDQLGWASRMEDQDIEVHPVPLESARLVHRGFSRVEAANTASPELPSYDQLEGTMPRWRDLEGYYTRFGPVEPLLETVDDRYVIMNAGDELRFSFQALPGPPPGMRRDFVLIGDGWVKDGDYNTAFSKTVLPLPTHSTSDYTTPPTTLWEDPVYQAHRSDWSTYHTRYVAAGRFAEALVPEKSQEYLELPIPRP